MDPFDGKVAIVTGGASGIGRALGEALQQRGTNVVLADIDGERAASIVAASKRRGGKLDAATVDVRNADSVREVVDRVAQQHGRLDFLFNNAGIALFGEARDMTLEQWYRMIDVNIRGVVNGIAAAYPLMIRQGFGHIVNTASAAGLMAAPGVTAYAMTKHAVVGLSTSLRGEAARFGVRVSAVCPGFIDTPIKDNMELLNLDRQALLRDFPFKLHPPEKCARAVLRGVEKNDPIITVTALAKVGWFFARLAPRLMTRLMQASTAYSPILKQTTGRNG